jgi:putative ABC transport system substrate-binding protein
MGLVRSLPRPGGNVTGFSAYDIPMMGKWLDLLAKVAPAVMRVAVIFHPESASWTAAYNDAIKQYASSFGMMIELAPVHDDAEIERAIAEHARDAGGALLVMPEAFSISHRDTIIAAATRYRLPTIGMNDILPRTGGLMSYAVDPAEASAQAASYIDRILRGTKPADLPVQTPTKLSFVINLKTAKALGLEIPPGVLALADEVIE